MAKTIIKPHKRHRLIFNLIKSQGPLTITQIYDSLLSQDYSVTRKMIERDLQVMSNDSDFGLTSDLKKPENFFVNDAHKAIYPIPLSPENIQILALTLLFLKKSTPVNFEDFINELETKIQSHIPKILCQELFKNYEEQLIQYGPVGRTKKLVKDEMRRVLQALREGKAFTSIYDSKNTISRKSKLRKFAPLRLELFGGAFYLLVKDLDFPSEGIKRLKINRISNITTVNDKFSRPDQNEIDLYKKSYGGVGGPRNKRTKIELTGDKTIEALFEENEFDSEQTVKKISPNQVEVELKIPMPNIPFARRLAGYGGNITRIEPAELRDMVLAFWQDGLKKLTQEDI